MARVWPPLHVMSVQLVESVITAGPRAPAMRATPLVTFRGSGRLPMQMKQLMIGDMEREKEKVNSIRLMIPSHTNP